jgi:hypothetical protein
MRCLALPGASHLWLVPPPSTSYLAQSRAGAAAPCAGLAGCLGFPMAWHGARMAPGRSCCAGQRGGTGSEGAVMMRPSRPATHSCAGRGMPAGCPSGGHRAAGRTKQAGALMQKAVGIIEDSGERQACCVRCPACIQGVARRCSPSGWLAVPDLQPLAGRGTERCCWQRVRRWWGCPDGQAGLRCLGCGSAGRCGCSLAPCVPPRAGWS